MDRDTHALYRDCTECPDARRTLQRMASVRDRAAFVRDHYHTLFDDVLLAKQRPFAYRVGQWYTKHLRLAVHVDTVHLRGNLRLTSRIDDGRYVDRQQALVQERGVPVHRLVERVEQGVRWCLETFDNDVLMHGTDEVDAATLAHIQQDTVEAVRTRLSSVMKEVKRRNRCIIAEASGGHLPSDVHSVVDACLYGE